MTKRRNFTHYTPGKQVRMADNPERVGKIVAARHTADRYTVMWEERIMGYHTRGGLLPYKA